MRPFQGKVVRWCRILINSTSTVLFESCPQEKEKRKRERERERVRPFLDGWCLDSLGFVRQVYLYIYNILGFGTPGCRKCLAPWGASPAAWKEPRERRERESFSLQAHTLPRPLSRGRISDSQHQQEDRIRALTPPGCRLLAARTWVERSEKASSNYIACNYVESIFPSAC